jgi:hypothetical protein
MLGQLWQRAGRPRRRGRRRSVVTVIIEHPGRRPEIGPDRVMSDAVSPHAAALTGRRDDIVLG